MKKLNCVFIAFVLICSGCQKKDNQKLMIATASNMQFAMKEIVRSFTAQTGIACETVVSSSGKLTAQIKEGAPYDVFVSADMKYPLDLFNNNFTTNKPEVYAYGKLVLWSMIDSVQPSIDLLSDEKINHISIANPKTAPYGAAAIDVLKYYNLFEKVEDKLVYGESIAQTNQFIISRSAEIGFTAKSVVLSSKMKGKGRWTELDDKSYALIAQGVVLIKNKNKVSKEAQKFYHFLLSSSVKKILENHGYLVQQ